MRESKQQANQLKDGLGQLRIELNLERNKGCKRRKIEQANK